MLPYFEQPMRSCIAISWHRHVDSVAAKASRTLGFLRRNLGQCTKGVKSTAYTSLVRLVLEYASPAMDPTSSEGIVKLEKVQRQAARFVHGNYAERDPGCVTRMVSDLGWENLESRRKKDRLTTLYKIRHGLVDMDTGDVLRLNDRRTRGQQRLYQPTANVKVYKDSFFPRTIQDWNRLPAVVTDSPTIEEFRAGLKQQVPTLRCQMDNCVFNYFNRLMFELFLPEREEVVSFPRCWSTVHSSKNPDH